MPIHVFDKMHTQLAFGLGDILVSPGLLSTDECIGVVIFQQKEPESIGTKVEYEHDIEVPIENTPVRMTFTKTESIDVLIRTLQEAKTMMLNNSTREGVF